MRVKIPFEGLTDSEADVSATVETNVLFNLMNRKNPSTVALQLAGIASTLDEITLKHFDNLGWMRPEEEEKLRKAAELIVSVYEALSESADD